MANSSSPASPPDPVSWQSAFWGASRSCVQYRLSRCRAGTRLRSILSYRTSDFTNRVLPRHSRHTRWRRLPPLNTELIVALRLVGRKSD
jgi:hypothetical protein